MCVNGVNLFTHQSSELAGATVEPSKVFLTLRGISCRTRGGSHLKNELKRRRTGTPETAALLQVDMNKARPNDNLRTK